MTEEQKLENNQSTESASSAPAEPAERGLPAPTPETETPPTPIENQPEIATTTPESQPAEQPTTAPTVPPAQTATATPAIEQPETVPSASPPTPVAASASETMPVKQEAPAPVTATSTSSTLASIPVIGGLIEKLKQQLKTANEKRLKKKQENLEKIMACARQKQKITNQLAQRLTHVSRKQAERYLEVLVGQGKLVRFGKTKNTFYKPTQ